jgi:hypothetical protein
MPYRINSPNAQASYQIDENRLNRADGASLDYQLAEIQNEHPDWTPDQVRMAQQGALGGAPSQRLLTGYGLPARYRITGADPQQQPPISAVNPGSFGVNSLANSIARQQNQFRLGQITRAQSELDKLDPSDEDNTDKISELKGRIGALTEENSSGPAPAPAQPAVPLGEGTAGQEAPVYQAGGPGTSVNLSNGGNIYFGPAAGAPPFRVGSSPAPAPAGAPAASAQGVTNYFPGTPQPFSIPGPMTLGQDDSGDTAPAAPVPVVPTAKISLRNKLAAQQAALSSDNAPADMQNSVSNRIYKIDNSVTNPPSVFQVGPQSAAQQVSPNATPDQSVRVRNKTTGAMGTRLPDGTIVPDPQ